MSATTTGNFYLSNMRKVFYVDNTGCILNQHIRFICNANSTHKYILPNDYNQQK